MRLCSSDVRQQQQNFCCVCGIAVHILSDVDLSRRQPSEMRWTSSAKYLGAWPDSVCWTRQASWTGLDSGLVAVKLVQHWHHVISLSWTSNEACSSVLYWLHFLYKVLRHSIQQWFAVIKTTQNESVNTVTWLLQRWVLEWPDAVARVGRNRFGKQQWHVQTLSSPCQLQRQGYVQTLWSWL